MPLFSLTHEEYFNKTMKLHFTSNYYNVMMNVRFKICIALFFNTKLIMLQIM